MFRNFVWESTGIILHNLEMQEVEGQRKGSVLYLHNDYLYRRDKERNGIKAFRCRRESCPARARQKNGEDVVNFFSSHNHGMEDIDVLNSTRTLHLCSLFCSYYINHMPAVHADNPQPKSCPVCRSIIHGKLHLHFVLWTVMLCHSHINLCTDY